MLQPPAFERINLIPRWNLMVLPLRPFLLLAAVAAGGFLLILPPHAEAYKGQNILRQRRHHSRVLPYFHVKHTHGKFMPGPWSSAHATFYGGPDGSETRGGACGFEDTLQHGYGLQTAALSTALFNDGLTCGACYEIKCVKDQQWCKPGNPSVIVTATNLCPPNPAQPSDNGGWCNPPRVHFDLSQPAYLQIAEYKAGIVPIAYRRIPCKKQGGIRFTITGNRYYTEILVWNVAGAGDVRSVLVKGNKLKWTTLARTWGQKWKTDADLVGQSLTFRVITGDHRKSTSWHVTLKDWQYGQTFEGKNFRI